MFAKPAQNERTYTPHALFDTSSTVVRTEHIMLEMSSSSLDDSADYQYDSESESATTSTDDYTTDPLPTTSFSSDEEHRISPRPAGASAPIAQREDEIGLSQSAPGAFVCCPFSPPPDDDSDDDDVFYSITALGAASNCAALEHVRLAETPRLSASM